MHGGGNVLDRPGNLLGPIDATRRLDIRKAPVIARSAATPGSSPRAGGAISIAVHIGLEIASLGLRRGRNDRRRKILAHSPDCPRYRSDRQVH